MRRILEARARIPELLSDYSRSEAQAVPVTLENQTSKDVASQLSRAVVPLVWSWAATRPKSSEPWKLVAFSARTTLASSTPKEQRLEYDRLMILSELLSAETAATRFLSFDLGPIASEFGLQLRLAGESYIAHRLPSGTSLGIGPSPQWPEYYINWPLTVDNEVRYSVSLADPVSAHGSPAYKHGYEPLYAKLFGIRHKPRGSYEPPMSAAVRVLYPYRIGDVWLSDSGLIGYVDWLGKGQPRSHVLQISARSTPSDPEPETRSATIAGATTAVAISSGSPAEVDLFLISPDTATIWDSRTWIPATVGLPLTITPDVEEELEVKNGVTSPPTDELDKIAVDADFAELLRGRWTEIQKCLAAEAFLAATVLAGSLLEGALLAFALSRESAAMAAKSAPRDVKTGATLPIPNWTLERLISVGTDLNWIGHGILRMADVVRTLRNTVHPWEARKAEGQIDQATAEICFDVVKRAISQLARPATTV